MKVTCCLGMLIIALSAVGAPVQAGVATQPETSHQAIASQDLEPVIYIDLDGDGIDDRSFYGRGITVLQGTSPAPVMITIDPDASQPPMLEPGPGKLERFRSSLNSSAGLREYRGGMGALLEEHGAFGTSFGATSQSHCVGGVCFPN